MAWAYVQSNTNQGGLSCAYTSNVTAGSLLVVVTNTAATFLTSITDTLANTWTKELNTNQGLERLIVWWTRTTSGGANTVSMTTNAGDRAMAVVEYSGLATSPLDSSTSAGGNNAAPNSGSVTVSQAGDLLVGIAVAYNSGGWTTSAGSGFTQRLNTWSGGTWCGISVEDKTSGSSEAATFTSTSTTWRCGAISFKIPSSGITSFASVGVSAYK